MMHGEKPAHTGSKPEDSQTLKFSVLVCTTGRMPMVIHCIESILQNENGPNEVVLLDQSGDNRVELAIERLRGDSRLRHVRLAARNKGIALNLGAAAATGDVIFITDDDCTVTPGWLDEYRTAFQNNPRLGIGFGRVDAVPYDPTKGYVPQNIITTSRLCKTMREAKTCQGIGANMAIRRSAMLEIGGFDPLLSPGGKFHASEDRDVMARCLMKGYFVYEAAQSLIIHDGFRNWDEGRKHTRQDWIGIGAMCGKFLRYRFWPTMPLVTHLLFANAVWPLVIKMMTARQKKGWARVQSFFKGLGQGWSEPLDRATMIFLYPETTASGEPAVAEAMAT